MQEEKFNETLDMYLSAKNVGPEARNKLKGLLNTMRKNRTLLGPALRITEKDLARVLRQYVQL